MDSKVHSDPHISLSELIETLKCRLEVRTQKYKKIKINKRKIKKIEEEDKRQWRREKHGRWIGLVLMGAIGC